ncbi:hypothetical protein BX600DRAFT_189915 [Xylariales sp. PMI_506]|nr:hypothetical protein BX600DRAFT_189915 [Xylariales sp. PMI_506]
MTPPFQYIQTLSTLDIFMCSLLLAGPIYFLLTSPPQSNLSALGFGCLSFLATSRRISRVVPGGSSTGLPRCPSPVAADTTEKMTRRTEATNWWYLALSAAAGIVGTGHNYVGRHLQVAMYTCRGSLLFLFFLSGFFFHPFT